MANAIYPLYKQALLTNGSTNISLDQNTTTDGPFVALVDTGTYTYSASHDFYNDLSGIVGTDQRLTSPTVTNGTFDGSDVTFTAVSGSSVEALVIYRKNSGANTTWRLVAFIDTGVTNLPVTPNGGDITITWNASGIFAL
jgi:activator of HSP90 ATPase